MQIINDKKLNLSRAYANTPAKNKPREFTTEEIGKLRKSIMREHLPVKLALEKHGLTFVSEVTAVRRLTKLGIPLRKCKAHEGATIRVSGAVERLGQF